MTKNLFFFLFISITTLTVTFPTILSAQNSEIGLQAGISTYQGELIVQAFDYKELHAAYGGFFRYNIFDYATIKLGISGGTISGKDANATREVWRKERNLSFRSNILEFALTGEINLLGFDPYNLKRTFSPYIFGGIGITRFNPKALYENEWVALQPLGTEGQGISGFESPYNLTTIVFPLGFGLKYAINDLWNIGLEIGARYTQTDYLDDVSTVYVDRNLLLNENGELSAILSNRSGEFLGTDPINYPTDTRRGNPETNDLYWFLGFSISRSLLDNGLVNSRNR